MTAMETYDTVILGAGAAGMMCAAHAAARGGRVAVIEHGKAPGEKIRISGGGRCNFTNLHTAPEAFLSDNPHFARSALARYTQWDFIDLVGRHGIAWHEKTLGQLFCDGSAKDIIRLLIDEMAAVGAELHLGTTADEIGHDGARFTLRLGGAGGGRAATARQLVVATGGKSIPKMGATGYGYHLAERFGHRLIAPRPALVPFTFGGGELAAARALAGVATPARVRAGGGPAFVEALLFTHRGLSGPATLQASSYWHDGAPVEIDLLPGADSRDILVAARNTAGRRQVATVLAGYLPRRLAEAVTGDLGLAGNVADLPAEALDRLAARLDRWQVHPIGTEGYRTAEVTAGGVDTSGLSSKTMESRHLPGLFFIGEVVDVTGWLGGYNFQWAWSSGWAAGTAIAERRA